MRPLKTIAALVIMICLGSGCTNYSTKPSESSQDASKKWAFCVFNKSIELSDGSDDVALIVDTAMADCSTLNLEWRSSLAKDNLSPTYLGSYIPTVENGVRKSAQGYVLKKKADQKTQQPAKAKSTKKSESN